MRECYYSFITQLHSVNTGFHENDTCDKSLIPLVQQGRQNNIFTRRHPNVPGLLWSVNLGKSSSQSVMCSCLNAMLRKCFPPLTFHVPTATRTEDELVYSGCCSSIAFMMSGEAGWVQQGQQVYVFKGMFLYSAVSCPLDRSKRFTLHPLADLFNPTPTRLLWEAF